jgi:hypothetical protein
VARWQTLLKRTVVGIALLGGLAACEHLMKASEDRDAGLEVEEGQIFLAGLDVRQLGDRAVLEEFQGVLQENTEGSISRGFSNLIIDSLLETGYTTEFDLEGFRQQNGAEACVVAKRDKIAFHLANGGVVPASFGKIVVWGLRPDKRGTWSGKVNLCSWIKSGDSYDEYYIEMELLAGKEGSVKAVESSGDTSNPFPGTLELSPDLQDTSALLSLMNSFQIKLHGSGEAIDVTGIWKNGLLLPPLDEAYINDMDCFDIFFRTDADFTAAAAGSLPEQENYCMGRCDALILNTH